MSNIIFLLLGLGLSFQTYANELHEWGDKTGTIHFTSAHLEGALFDEHVPVPVAYDMTDGSGGREGVPGSDPDEGQCARAQARLDDYEQRLNARTAEGEDEQALQAEFEALERFRENLERHCGS